MTYRLLTTALALILLAGSAMATQLDDPPTSPERDLIWSRLDTLATSPRHLYRVLDTTGIELLPSPYWTRWPRLIRREIGIEATSGDTLLWRGRPLDNPCFGIVCQEDWK